MRRVTKFRFGTFSIKQRQAVEWWMQGSPFADYDGIIADGSIRSGKTIAFILGFVLWSVKNFSGENFILSGKSIGALKRNVVHPMLSILAALRIKCTYNRSENYLEFGGNTYYLFGANNEASQDTLQGITAAGWLGDEVALQPQSFIEQAIGRCSVEGSKIWLNCNPESPNHYVYTDLVKQAKKKHLFHIHFTLDDNLTLSERIKERYRRMFSGVWFNRFILGEWCVAQGAIYDMFDEDVHVIDKLPDGLKIVQYWIACDYGTSNPTVFLLCGLGSDGNYYVLDEWRWDSRKQRRQKTDSEYAVDLKDFIKKHKIYPQSILIDPSAASFIAECRSIHIAEIRPADNVVLDGIRRVGALLSAKKLFFLSVCSGLIDEALGYVWDSKAQERGEDAPVKQRDHGLDALRYFGNHIKRQIGQIVGFS